MNPTNDTFERLDLKELRGLPLPKTLTERLQSDLLCMHPGTCSSSYSGGEPCGDCEDGCRVLSCLDELLCAIDNMTECNCMTDDDKHAAQCVERSRWVAHLKEVLSHGLV